MNFLFIRTKKDTTSFHVLQAMGAKIFEIDDLEKIDEVISKSVENNYKTFFLSSEVAGASQDITKKYKRNPDIRIFIAPSKRI